jgi:putative effector of murein hydrolase
VARRLGFAPVTEGPGDGAGLAGRIAADAPKGGGVLWHLHGTHVAGDVTAMLQAQGIRARDAAIYDQVAMPLGAEAAALLAGSLTAIVSVLVIGKAFGLSATMLASLAPKSTTAPVAIGIAEGLGGEPTITAVLVLLTGMFGAIVVTPLLNLLRVHDWRARGFAVGVAAHGIGTARAFQVNETAGAFASIGMGLNAVLTAVLAPLVLRLFQ